ncbi:MAG: hypothetical protein F6K09_26485, partial [Merismopedia sp. SIO2A8]|nr:hypothetical protein [Merismopedia sp. SIO2A8]
MLTGAQQAYLQQRIVLEVAEYWRDRRQHLLLSASTNHPFGQRFLSVPQERETMLRSVRYVRRFIGWMQRGPVAIATNLFQEAALVPALSNSQLADGAMGPQSMGHRSMGKNQPMGHGQGFYPSIDSIPMGYDSSSFKSQFIGQLLEPAPIRSLPPAHLSSNYQPLGPGA